MYWWEILIVCAIVSFTVGVIILSIIKKIKGKNNTCASCNSCCSCGCALCSKSNNYNKNACNNGLKK